MKVIYLDELDQELLAKDTEFIPRVGDSVQFGNTTDYFVVKEVIWNVVNEIVLVVVAEPSIKRSETEDNLPARLSEIKNTIISVSKRQDVLERKNRALREQLVSVRTNLRSLAKPKPVQ
jgi:hypothetical protein